MQKLLQYILLPTKKETNLFLSGIGEKLYYNKIHQRSYDLPQHLYILSDDEIKQEDWVYCPYHLGNLVSKSLGKGCSKCRKIIATTNPELHTKRNHLHDGLDNEYVIDVPKIFQSDIEYIVSLHNRIDKEVDVEKLGKEFASDVSEDAATKLYSGFINGYNKCLQDNADRMKQLLEWLEEEIKEDDKFDTDDSSECYGIFGNALSMVESKIKSLTNEQPKSNTVIVEYEGLCIQTGMPCGFPCIGDCEKVSIKMPKLKEGNIIISKE